MGSSADLTVLIDHALSDPTFDQLQRILSLLLALQLLQHAFQYRIITRVCENDGAYCSLHIRQDPQDIAFEREWSASRQLPKRQPEISEWLRPSFERYAEKK